MKPYPSGLHGVLAVTLLAAAAAATASCAGVEEEEPAPRRFYKQTNLVSDIPGRAAHTDANLVNPWGIAYGPETPFWVANNGSGRATVHAATGAPFPATNPLVVRIPRAPGAPAGTVASPTGIVFNGSSDFKVGAYGRFAPALFLFATEDGTISAWNPVVDPTNAILVAYVQSGERPVYKGLAISEEGDIPRLYAADFRGAKIDVFDTRFRDVDLGATAFRDPAIPSGFAPFNIQRIDEVLYVTYARQDADREEDVPGVGNGYVNAYSMDGRLLRRVASGGALNSPWGVAVAPDHFGALSGALLIGNFGDGYIHAFDRETYAPLGALKDASGRPIAIEGLWGITAGNGAAAGDSDKLYFAAGIDGEAHGLFGSLESLRERKW